MHPNQELNSQPRYMFCLGTETHNLDMCSAWESNLQPFDVQDNSPGKGKGIFEYSLVLIRIGKMKKPD